MTAQPITAAELAECREKAKNEDLSPIEAPSPPFAKPPFSVPSSQFDWVEYWRRKPHPFREAGPVGMYQECWICGRRRHHQIHEATRSKP